jgi:predicted RNase H-like HicB family nuclease
VLATILLLYRRHGQEERQTFKKDVLLLVNMQKEKYFMDIVINKEALSDGSPVFVAHCTSLGIASQGKDVDEAIANIREAIELYLEEQPEKYDELPKHDLPLFSVVEVTRNAKVADSVR